MRIAIVSDTHFGDPMCTLVTRNNTNKIVPGTKYEDFKKAAGRNNDFLILVGDIFDFSISSYQEAYEHAKIFFFQIQRDQIAKEIILVPGNHDADLWHIVEHETNIINQIRNGQMPRPFRLSLPGFLDDRKGSPSRGFTLPGVRAKPGQKGPKYAGLYLDNITVTIQNEKKVGKPTLFNFCYPNIYMVTDNESVLITHGHYFETYWALTSEWAMKLAPEDVKVGEALDLHELVGINFPLSQLACSGVGQAGPLTKVVRQLQRDVKDRDLKRVKKYLDRLKHEIDKMTRFPWSKQYLKWLTGVISDRMKKMVQKSITNKGETRYDEEFIHTKEVQERFMNFYSSSLLEIGELNMEYGYDIPPPRYVIFGHTHQPIPWKDPKAPKAKVLLDAGVKSTTLFNTGGWLHKKGDDLLEFVGAEVFTYSTQKGFKSVSIR
jgi:UDP-2,3-diacylglucosamine pyrophosphatase LpxH